MFVFFFCSPGNYQSTSRNPTAHFVCEHDCDCHRDTISEMCHIVFVCPRCTLFWFFRREKTTSGEYDESCALLLSDWDSVRVKTRENSEERMGPIYLSVVCEECLAYRLQCEGCGKLFAFSVILFVGYANSFSWHFAQTLFGTPSRIMVCLHGRDSKLCVIIVFKRKIVPPLTKSQLSTVMPGFVCVLFGFYEWASNTCEHEYIQIPHNRKRAVCRNVPQFRGH